MQQLIIIVAMAVLAAMPLQGNEIFIHCGQLVDTVSGKTRQKVTLQVEGDRITAVHKGLIRVKKGQVIDLSHATVLPGLFDLHVHFQHEAPNQGYQERPRWNPTDFALRATTFAKITLMHGFTSVRDLGGDPQVVIGLRNAIHKGWIEGPRIFAAGKSIATTGGHADPTNGYRDDLIGELSPRTGVINGPEEAREAVRWRYKEGADVIKITATGGVLSLAKSGQNPQFTEEELRALMAAAADYDFVVAAHAHGKEGMLRAIAAGIHSIEHGTYADVEVFAAMKANGTYLVPTISAGRYVAEKAKIDGFFPEVVRPKAAAVGPQIESTFAAAYKAGVKIAFGTDSGVSAHGDNWKEFVFMVEAGMPAMEAIQAATIEAARLLRVDDRLGSLEQGKIADIIAVRNDPLDNIKNIQDVVFVMKAGSIYKQIP